jgi:spermidine synthase
MGVRSPGRAGFAAIAFFMGLEAAIVQVVLIREILTVCRGNELIIGMIFSSWFLGIVLGARFNPAGESKRLERRVLASMALLPLCMAVSVYGAHAVQMAVPRLAGTFYTFSAEILLALACTAPAGFFVGFFFPPLVALVAADIGERSGGFIFYIESLGSFIGGMAFSFLLVEVANPLALAAGLLCAALVIIAFIKNRKLVPVALIPLACVFFSGRIETGIIAGVWERTHAGKLQDYRRTKYQTVAVESSGDTVSVYGDGILLYTLPDGYESRGIFHLVNALRGDRKKVLLMGSGPGSLLQNLLRTDIERLGYIEPDPGLWDAVAPFREKLYPDIDDTKLSLYREDPRHFLSRSAERYDMIISMPPAPENIMLNRFYTREFYALCKSRLSERGVIVCSLHGFSNYMSPELRAFIASIYRGFTNEFPVHLKTSGETMFLIGAAGKNLLPRDGDDLVDRYGRRPPSSGSLEKEITDNFSPAELRMFFEKTHIRYFDEVMERIPGGIAENRDMKPEAYWRNIMLTAFREQSLLYALVHGYLFLPALLLLAAGAALRDIRRKYGTRRMAAGAVISATGLAGMSTMMIMIILYQNAHGIVYYRISLINALFMLGLTLGSFFASRGRSSPGLAAIVAGIAVSVGFILASTWIGSDAVFWPLLILFSFLCGALFPSLFSAIGGNGYRESASVLDAMDHFGAIAGSLLTVMFFLPLLGIQGTLAAVLAMLLPALAVARMMSRSKIPG